MYFRYDAEGDVLFVELRPEAKAATGKRLDEQRIIHRNADGSVAAVEFLFVSKGVNLEGVPEADRIAAAMRSFPTPTLVPGAGARD